MKKKKLKNKIINIKYVYKFVGVKGTISFLL